MNYFTAGPIGGPPLAAPPVTIARTTTLPLSLMLIEQFFFFKYDLNHF
jgi:hypothetical protein